MDFYSAYAQGFARVATVTIPVALADPAKNAATVIAQAQACADEQVALAVFPELCLSGYSVDDLFLQETLLDAVENAIAEIVEATSEINTTLVVGAPLMWRNRIYNTAVVIHAGEILGVVPKSYLPTYGEFYERRWFAPGDDVDDAITIGGEEVPISSKLIFAAADLRGFAFHVEICEDMWVPVPPSAQAALAGATVLVNLSASPVTVGRAESRRLLVSSASARCNAAYLYTAAGAGESTTDLAWDGQAMIYECGDLLGESARFEHGAQRTIVDIDLDRIRAERRRQGSFDDNRRGVIDADDWQVVEYALEPAEGDIGLYRKIDRFPFVPDNPERLAQDAYETFNIQVAGLVQRVQSIGTPKLVIGISGGLDSTHALLVAAEAMDRLGRPRTDILAFTLPGFATSETTKSNAIALMEALGTTYETIDITPTATTMLRDIGHPFADGAPTYDVTFENVQAGLRTDYLFRIANQRGGIVVGTGDLSELALGWCTYGVGDQMSHYNVNAGIPKTLIQHVIRWVISNGTLKDSTVAVLAEILDQEISPELVPVTAGEKPQSTEAVVGPYALQDFNLFHVVRHGHRPSKIAFMAWHAWRDQRQGDWPPAFPEASRGEYDLGEIRDWLEVFIKRFFTSQFKRSALPNGPKVSGGGTMSPRGDWRMPSDASSAAWLADLENVPFF